MIGGYQYSNLSYGFGSVVNGLGYAKDKFYSDASTIGNSVNSFFFTPHGPSEDRYSAPITPYNQSFARTAAEAFGYSTPQFEYDYEWQQKAFDSLADKSTSGLGLGALTVGSFIAGNALFSTVPLGKMSKFGAKKGASFLGAKHLKTPERLSDWFKFNPNTAKGFSRVAGRITHGAGLGAGLGVGAMGLAGSALGAAAGVLPGFAAMTAVDKYFDSFMEVIKDRNQIGNFLANNSNRFVSGKPGERYSSGGFTRKEGENIADYMESIANNSTVFSMGDLKGVLTKGVEIGTFRGSKDVDDFKKKFKDLTNTLKIVTTSLKQTLDQGMDTIKQLNSLGIKSSSDQIKFLTLTESTALASGKTAQEMMNAGILGAQIFKGSGIHLSAGAAANQFNYANISSLHRNGGLTTQDIEQAGGESSLAQLMTGRTLGMLRSPLGKTMLLGMSSNGEFDRNKFNEFISGKTDIFKMGLNAVNQADTPYKILNFESKQNEIISNLQKSYGGAGGEFSKFLLGFARAKATAQATGINTNPESLRTIMTAQFKQSGISDSEIKAMFGMLDYSDDKFKDQEIAIRKQIQNKFVEDFDQKYSLTARFKKAKNTLKETFISHPAEDVGKKFSSARDSIKSWWDKKAYGIDDDNLSLLSETDLVSSLKEEFKLFKKRSISELSSENFTKILNTNIKSDSKDFGGIKKSEIVNTITKSESFNKTIDKFKNNRHSLAERNIIVSELKDNLKNKELSKFIKLNPGMYNSVNEAIDYTTSEISQIVASSNSDRYIRNNKTKIEDGLKNEQNKMLSNKESQLMSLFSSKESKVFNNRYSGLESKILESAYGKFLDRDDVKNNIKILSDTESTEIKKENAKNNLLNLYSDYSKNNNSKVLNKEFNEKGLSILKKNLDSNFSTNYKEDAESIKKFKSDMTEVPWLGKRTSAQALEKAIKKGLIKLNPSDIDSLNKEINNNYVSFPNGLKVRKSALNKLSKQMEMKISKSFLSENDSEVNDFINNDSSILEGISGLISGKKRSVDEFINESFSTSSNFSKFLSSSGNKKYKLSLENNKKENFNFSDLNELGQKVLVKSFQGGGKQNDIEDFIDSSNLIISGKYGNIKELNERIKSVGLEKDDLMQKSYESMFFLKNNSSSPQVINSINSNILGSIKKIKDNKEFGSLFEEFVSNEYDEKNATALKTKLGSIINTDKNLSDIEKKTLNEQLFMNMKNGDPLKHVRDKLIDKKIELDELFKDKQNFTMDILTDTSKNNLDKVLEKSDLLSQNEKDTAKSIFNKLKGNDLFSKSDFDELSNLREKDISFRNATDNLNESIKSKLQFDNFEKNFIKRDSQGNVINSGKDISETFLNIIKDRDYSAYKRITENSDVREMFNKKVFSDSGRKEIETNIIKNQANYGAKNEAQINSTINGFSEITPELLGAMKKTLNEILEMCHALNVMKKQLNIQHK